MSSMKVTLHRSNNQRIFKIDINCDYSGLFDYATILFKCGENTLEILSSSKGSIINKEIKLNGATQLQSFVEYCSQNDILECLIGYYNKKELIHYENLSNVFDSRKTIEELTTSIPELRTVKNPFFCRFADFKTTLKRNKSFWNAKLKQHNDILILFLSTGQQPALLSFGEESEEILASDYIFPIEPSVTKLYIPQDFFAARRNQYSSGCKLGIFELVKPDFVSVQNLYFKVPICSTIPLSEFSSKK